MYVEELCANNSTIQTLICRRRAVSSSVDASFAFSVSCLRGVYPPTLLARFFRYVGQASTGEHLDPQYRQWFHCHNLGTQLGPVIEQHNQYLQSEIAATDGDLSSSITSRQV